jgi:hypothetical protein
LKDFKPKEAYYTSPEGAKMKEKKNSKLKWGKLPLIPRLTKDDFVQQMNLYDGENILLKIAHERKNRAMVKYQSLKETSIKDLTLDGDVKPPKYGKKTKSKRKN